MIENVLICFIIFWNFVLNEVFWDIIDDLFDSVLMVFDMKVMMRENRRLKLICNKEIDYVM